MIYVNQCHLNTVIAGCDGLITILYIGMVVFIQRMVGVVIGLNKLDAPIYFIMLRLFAGCGHIYHTRAILINNQLKYVCLSV